MNRNVICTIKWNLPTHLYKNSGDSVRDAAQRWGCEYIELNKITRHHLFPSWSRPDVFPTLKHFDRVLFMDADMLIRSDAPSIFETYTDKTKLYCVKDISDDYSTEFKEHVTSIAQIPYLSYMNECFENSMSLDEFHNGFFNCGLLLFSVKPMMPVIESFVKHIPPEDFDKYNYKKIPPPGTLGSLHHEQALFNYCCKLFLKDRIEYIPNTWNKMHIAAEDLKMDNYILHFNEGSGDNKERLLKCMSTFDWRV